MEVSESAPRKGGKLNQGDKLQKRKMKMLPYCPLPPLKMKINGEMQTIEVNTLTEKDQSYKPLPKRVIRIFKHRPKNLQCDLTKTKEENEFDDHKPLSKSVTESSGVDFSEPKTELDVTENVKEPEKLDETQLLNRCPLCQTVFEAGTSQLEQDGHIAACFSMSHDDITW